MSGSAFCFPSNPDISGIGIQVAIYTQNLLSFVPAAFALYNKKVTQTEFDTIETPSTTIIITAFAILISVIVQTFTKGLTNLYTVIILNLSWMNNTFHSMFITGLEFSRRFFLARLFLRRLFLWRLSATKLEPLRRPGTTNLVMVAEIEAEITASNIVNGPEPSDKYKDASNPIIMGLDFLFTLTTVAQAGCHIPPQMARQAIEIAKLILKDTPSEMLKPLSTFFGDLAKLVMLRGELSKPKYVIPLKTSPII